MASLIHATAHGLSAGDTFRFGNVVPTNTGIDETATYYVLAAGLTADDFEFSETDGGAAFVLAYAITDGVIRNADDYEVVDDNIMSPPDAPDAPTSFALTSDTEIDADGHSVHRLDISLVQPTSATLHHSVVTIVPAVGESLRAIIPVGQTTASIRGVKAGVLYTGHANAYDGYGLVSSASNTDTETPTGDTTAPAQVTGAAAFGAILGIIATWSKSAAADLSHYEVDIDDNSGFASPDTYVIKGNVFALQQITAGTYYLRIRAVDLSGNAGTYSSTVSAASRTVQTADLTDALITAAKLVAGAVGSVALADDAVTEAKIATDAVTADAIKAGEVGSAELAALAVTSAKLDALAVTTAKLDALAVTTAKIAADAVTAAEIATGAVGSTELAAGAVIAGKITAGTIVAADIAAATITGAKIAAGTITATNIAADTITANEIAANAIDTSELNALAVTAAKIAANTITAAKIAAGTITTTEIAALTIVAANIAAGTIVASKIAAGTITTNEIAALTIVAANIAAGTITGAKIAAGTITASNITADTITANEIAASAITSSELAANAVIAGKILAGTIVTGDLNATCSIQLVSNSGATVVIDSTGITITNGKLILQDEFGSTAITSTGFAGSWSDFIHLGLYNARFLAGTVGTVTNGRSSKLPFWTASDTDAGGTLTYFTSGGLATGPGVKFTWGAVSDQKQIASDAIPNVSAYGSALMFGVRFAYNRAAGTIRLRVWVEASDDSTFASGVTSTTVQTFSQGAPNGSGVSDLYGVGDLTHQGKYIRLVVDATEQVAHNGTNKFEIYEAYCTPIPQVNGYFTAGGAAGNPLTDTPSLVVNDAVDPPVAVTGNLKVSDSIKLGSGSNKVSSGSAFPGSPATSDLCWRTDYGMWFFYDGTRWSCCCLHTGDTTIIGGTQPFSATSSTMYALVSQDVGTDIWIEDVETTFFVASGATALGSSHKWVLTATYLPSGTAGTALSAGIDTGSSNVWRKSGLVTVDALIGNDDTMIRVTCTKTGTPGNLTVMVKYHYRIVAT